MKKWNKTGCLQLTINEVLLRCLNFIKSLSIVWLWDLHMRIITLSREPLTSLISVPPPPGAITLHLQSHCVIITAIQTLLKSKLVLSCCLQSCCVVCACEWVCDCVQHSLQTLHPEDSLTCCCLRGQTGSHVCQAAAPAPPADECDRRPWMIVLWACTWWTIYETSYLWGNFGMHMFNMPYFVYKTCIKTHGGNVLNICNMCVTCI